MFLSPSCGHNDQLSSSGPFTLPSLGQGHTTPDTGYAVVCIMAITGYAVVTIRIGIGQGHIAEGAEDEHP